MASDRTLRNHDNNHCYYCGRLTLLNTIVLDRPAGPVATICIYCITPILDAEEMRDATALARRRQREEGAHD